MASPRAESGDTVLVPPATYLGELTRNLYSGGKTITVMSSGGRGVTVVDAENVSRVFSLTQGGTCDSVLSGFTIQNGYAVCDGGICCNGTSPTIASPGHLASSRSWALAPRDPVGPLLLRRRPE